MGGAGRGVSQACCQPTVPGSVPASARARPWAPLPLARFYRQQVSLQDDLLQLYRL